MGLKLVGAKCSEIPSASDTKSIVEIMGLLGDRVRDMLIACRTVEPFPLPYGVRAVNAAHISGIFIYAAIFVLKTESFTSYPRAARILMSRSEVTC